MPVLNKAYLREHLLTGEPWEALQLLLLDHKAMYLGQLVENPSPPTSLLLAGRIAMCDQLLGIKHAFQLMDILESQEKEARSLETEDNPPVDDGM